MAGRQPKHQEVVEEKTASRTKKPSLYRVFLLNDDYTTMEFVVHVLETVFHKAAAEATQIMLHVHKKGRGLAGIYPKDIAETKVSATEEMARTDGFPLRCEIERE